MRPIFLLPLAVLSALATGCANHRVIAAATPPPPSTPAPVVISKDVRESLPNDYLRISFFGTPTPITSLAHPGALRAFTTATPLYEPPLLLKNFPYYSGMEDKANSILVVMRCRPPQPEKVDAVLATWPNIFGALQRDVPTTPATCAANPPDIATQVSCYAAGFTDPAVTAVPLALAHTFSYAGVLFDADHTAYAKWLDSSYGIYPAFAGSGYSVKNSYNLSAEPMTSQQILVKSISSEYVLKNVSLGDAGCRCISVAPYPGRSNDPIDPDFIQQAGGDGSCKSVDRLQTAPH